ncbi:MAG: signal recognition particle receptor subunit alpha, partial [Campylobacter sp.]|nr:signal recognition particle receptor subunit alpha [Campylobacter sp.]
MFNFFKKGFDKTIEAMKSANSSNKITKENLEEMLLEADVSYEIVEEILYYLPPQNEVKKDDLKR